MKKNGGGAVTSYRPPAGKRVLWETESTDNDCDCLGPPPQFYLPPPPRPSSLIGSDCSENSISDLETCDALPVIDPEYHYSPAVPSLAIILAVAVVVLVFLFIGTFLVALKKKKIQCFFHRKPSNQSRCDAASSNGVIYEDLTNIRPRTLSSHSPSGQTTLPSLEMTNVVSCQDAATFSSAFICPSSSLPDTFNSQELFNPVYEELSNESGERGETDSEGMPQAAVSEDEFAEDELSLGGEPDIGLGLRIVRKNGPLKEFVGKNIKDVDFSDADDKCKFLENCEKNSIPFPDRWEKGRKTSRVLFIRGATKRLKCLDRRKLWKNKELPSLPASVDFNDFHEGVFIKRIFQIYPDVTGVNFQHPLDPSDVPPSEDRLSGDGHFESLAAFSQTPSRRLKPKIYSTLGAIKSSVKNQNQDSSKGSDSGYSNNTSDGISSFKVSKGYRLPNRSNSLLS